MPLKARPTLKRAPRLLPDQSQNRRSTQPIIAMRTSLLPSTLLLLGFASTGMASWDWSLDNIGNFKTEIPVSIYNRCNSSVFTRIIIFSPTLSILFSGKMWEGIMGTLFGDGLRYLLKYLTLFLYERTAIWLAASVRRRQILSQMDWVNAPKPQIWTRKTGKIDPAMNF